MGRPSHPRPPQCNAINRGRELVLLKREEARIKHTRFGIGETLDLDRVLPSVAEVIEIDELPGADIFENVVELRLRASRKSPTQSASRSGVL